MSVLYARSFFAPLGVEQVIPTGVSDIVDCVCAVNATTTALRKHVS
jgi:hypothetical protein